MTVSRLSTVLDESGTVVASGVVDAHTSEGLARTLHDQGTESDVALDLGGVDFIDSSGLRVIVTAHQALEDAGRRLVLVGLSESVQSLFDITGLGDHLHRSSDGS